jgi:hypothetical protein
MQCLRFDLSRVETSVALVVERRLAQIHATLLRRKQCVTIEQAIRIDQRLGGCWRPVRTSAMQRSTPPRRARRILIYSFRSSCVFIVLNSMLYKLVNELKRFFFCFKPQVQSVGSSSAQLAFLLSTLLIYFYFLSSSI